MQRRNFFRVAAGTVLAAWNDKTGERLEAATQSVKDRTPESLASDEEFWAEVRGAFTLDANIINLQNGSISPPPRVVQEAMHRYLDYGNLSPTYHHPKMLAQVENVRRRLAAYFGCDAEEIAITRSGSESVEIPQMGLDLKRGDEIVTTRHDYPRMIHSWRQRQAREGIALKMVSYPVPPKSMDDLVRRIEEAITPRTRVILVCHMTFTTGQIFPIKKICQLGRERNIEVVVDGAHTFGHIPFKQADLDCDYYGTSLHKWAMAPGGTGFTFVRKSKIPQIWPLQPASDTLTNDIRKFEQVGTHSPAQHNAITEALNFLETLGVARKAARFRYLRERWTTRLSSLPRVRILTSSDPAQSCCLGAMSIQDADTAAHAKLADTLVDKYGILVAAIGKGNVDYLEVDGFIRVTPNFFTHVREVDAFCNAVETELKV